MGEIYRLTVDSTYPLQPSVWRELVKLKAEYRCEDCGARGRGPFHGTGSGTVTLCAHHIDGNGHLGTLYNTLANGRALCASCHRREHGRMGRERTTSRERRDKVIERRRAQSYKDRRKKVQLSTAAKSDDQGAS